MHSCSLILFFIFFYVRKNVIDHFSYISTFGSNHCILQIFSFTLTVAFISSGLGSNILC